MRLCGILLTWLCLLCDGILNHEPSKAKLLGSYSNYCIYICRHFDKHYAYGGQGKMGMEGNISERRGGKGNLVFGNCVDGSVGGGRSRGKSGPIGGAERD